MMQGVLETIRWSLTIASKFTKKAFFYTSLIVVLTLVSQIATLLASVMPLKVVILLGSETIPSYIPNFLTVKGRDFLIISLSVATIGCFILFLVVERLILITTSIAIKRLLLQSHKMVLFENQDEIAENSYLQFSRALAGGTFVVIAYASVLMLYPNLGVVLIGYVSMAVCVIWFLTSISAEFLGRLEERLTKVITLVSGIGFFAAFLFMVADFIWLKPPGVLIAIISLMLSRQLLARFSGAVLDIASLFKQRYKIDALFFHGKVLLPAQVQEEKTIWSLLGPVSRKSWIPDVLNELVKNYHGCDEINYIPSGVKNVSSISILDYSSSKEYFLKLFERNRRSLALHESTLIGEQVEGLPSPKYVGSTYVSSFYCMVYELPKGRFGTSPKELRVPSLNLRGQLLSIEPPANLVQRYQRSHPMLWQRLDTITLKRLYMCANKEEQRCLVNEFFAVLPELRAVLKSLPLTIFNPDIKPVNIWLSESSFDSILLNWSRWGLDPLGTKWPIGAGFSVSKDQLEMLADGLKQALKARPSLESVCVEQVEIAALYSALEDRCMNQAYDEGLEIVSRLLDRIKILNNKAPTVKAMREKLNLEATGVLRP